jgi:phosphoribosylformylglycinamidine synthase
MNVRIFVTLKPEVLDPQGKAVEGGLKRLGFSEVEGARVGKLIQLKLNESREEVAKTRVKEMCEKLLANPVIENVRYEFAD